MLGNNVLECTHMSVRFSMEGVAASADDISEVETSNYIDWHQLDSRLHASVAGQSIACDER